MNRRMSERIDVFISIYISLRNLTVRFTIHVFRMTSSFIININICEI